MQRPKAVIFDMDGTLYDTETLSALGWREAAQRFGLQDFEPTIHDCVGLNRDAIEALLRERYGPSFPLNEFLSYTRNALQKRVEQNCPLKPGALELLDYLKEQGILIGMATSSHQNTAKERLTRSGLLDFFPVIVGGNMVEHSKPHPEPYQLACQLLHVCPNDSVGIEDSPNGVRSVHAAGLLPVMVPDTISPTPELTSLCWHVCTSLYEVLDILKNL